MLEQSVGDDHVAGIDAGADASRRADHHDGVGTFGEDRRRRGGRDLADAGQREDHVVAGQPGLQKRPPGHGVRDHLARLPGRVDDRGQFGVEGGDDRDHGFSGVQRPRKARNSSQQRSARSRSGSSQKMRSRGSVPEKRAMIQPSSKYTLQPSA